MRSGKFPDVTVRRRNLSETANLYVSYYARFFRRRNRDGVQHASRISKSNLGFCYAWLPLSRSVRVALPKQSKALTTLI